MIDDIMFEGFTEQETEQLLAMLSRMARNLSVGELSEREMMKDIIKKEKERDEND